MYYQIEEKNKKVKENMESQLESQFILDYQNRLLSTMDLERNQLKIAFSHPSAFTMSSSSGFMIVNLTVDAREIPLHDKNQLA